MDRFPRVQEVVLPILRQALPDDVTITSWVPDIDYRKYPVINVRRLGGPRHRANPRQMDLPVIEMAVYHNEGLPEAEDLYIRALEALYEAQKKQITINSGRIAHVRETMGATQFPAQFQDAYRIQGLIELGIRPPRKET